MLFSHAVQPYQYSSAGEETRDLACLGANESNEHVADYGKYASALEHPILAPDSVLMSQMQGHGMLLRVHAQLGG